MLAAVAMLVASLAAFFYSLESVAAIVFFGGICTRSGCRRWETHAGTLAMEALGLVIVMLLTGAIAYGAVRLLMGDAGTRPKQASPDDE